MSKLISTNSSKNKKLPYLSSDEYINEFGKGWSLSSVYNLTEIRDVFIALRNWNKEFIFKEFFAFCKKNNLPYKNTKWTKRRLLEHINALINFSLIEPSGKILNNLFKNSMIGSDLSSNDLLDFKKIFLTYFRFKEMLSWYLLKDNSHFNNFMLNDNLKSLIEKSSPLYHYSNNSRFNNCFFYELKNNPDIYQICNNNGDIMRFWDMFLKWGTTLEIIEKFSLRNIDIKIDNNNISCSYVISQNKINTNLVEFIINNFSDNYVYIPDLVFKLAISYRKSIFDIKQYILNQYIQHKDIFSFERTSEIFINKGSINTDKLFFIKHNDSYISHIIVRSK